MEPFEGGTREEIIKVDGDTDDGVSLGSFKFFGDDKTGDNDPFL